MAGASVAQALDEEASLDTPRFVSAASLPAKNEAFEAYVARTGQVPTRDNLHDLFNGLAWLRWPRLKRRLNRLHAERIAIDGVGATRGAVRDALTLFDENSALLEAPAALTQALGDRDWHSLFVVRRAEWSRATLTLFGHALLEKLVHPRKPVTAHVWLVGAGGIDALDPRSKPFAAMPVLGVPLWWPANEARGFYDDASVFRRPGLAMRAGSPHLP